MDIQKQILLKLSKANGLRFADIKQDAIESSLLSYHLKRLLKQGFIAKNRTRYFLTTAGLKEIASLKPLDAWGGSENLFKINVLLFVFRKNAGVKEILFKTRSRQPFFGYKTIPGGNIKSGESTSIAAKRLLFEKTGLHANFNVFGCLRKIFYSNTNPDEAFLDIVFYLATANYLSGELDSIKTEEHYWLPLTEAIAYLKNYSNLPHKINLEELQAVLEAIAHKQMLVKETKITGKNFH